MKLHLFALKFLGIFTILLTLSACGGGGSSDGISVDTSAISITAERNSGVDNLLYAGSINTSTATASTWAYADSGAELASYNFATSQRSIVISGDGKRMITLSGGIRMLTTP